MQSLLMAKDRCVWCLDIQILVRYAAKVPSSRYASSAQILESTDCLSRAIVWDVQLCSERNCIWKESEDTGCGRCRLNKRARVDVGRSWVCLCVGVWAGEWWEVKDVPVVLVAQEHTGWFVSESGQKYSVEVRVSAGRVGWSGFEP
jgi:hypothetical protein